MRTSLLKSLPLLALASCGFLGANGAPTVIAHRGGAGYFPENSRTAVTESLKRKWAGIEFDLCLTKDGVPVLSHDAWLNEDLCTRADGSPIGGEVLIKELTLAELHAGYRCGGIKDADTPDAQLKADTHLTFDELLVLAKDSPDTILHIDLKYEPGMTDSAEAFADAIVDRVQAAGLPNRVFYSSVWAEAIKAFEAKGEDITTIYTWPRFSRDGSTVGIALGSEAERMAGGVDLVGLIRAAGADGISVTYQVLDWKSAEAVRNERLLLAVWTVNGKDEQDFYCRFPADLLITDYPEAAPCK